MTTEKRPIVSPSAEIRTSSLMGVESRRICRGVSRYSTIIVKVMMMCIAATHGAFAALPPECVRLEYIASTGDQYIDTGIKLKCPDDRVYMKFMCTEISGGGVLFGNRETAFVNNFMGHYNKAWSSFAISVNNSNKNNVYDNRWYNTTQGNLGYTGHMMEIDASIKSITVIRDGINESASASSATRTFETPGTCTVLKGVAVDGGVLPNANGVIGRLYSFKIYRNGDLILDLVPVQTNGVALMCDRLNGTYYPNAGAGDFAAGPAMDLLTIAKEPLVPSCTPAPGGYDCPESGSILCSAEGGYTNHLYMVRSAVTGYVLETYDSLSGSWVAPVTNAGNSYVYSSGRFVRLTWLAEEDQEVLVQSDPIVGGNMTVNGTPMPTARDVRWTPPAGAKAVEYIASTGDQYIDTGIKLKCPDDRVYMKFMCTEISGGGVLFGNRETAFVNNFMGHYNKAWSSFAISVNNSNKNNVYDNRWYNTTQGNLGYTGHMMEIDASIKSITVIRDGINESASASSATRTFETPGTCTVLKGVAVDGGVLPNANGVIGRLYRFEIKRNGVPVLDLLPVTTNGVACMYDLVSGRYFGNVGSGAFLAGPELTEHVCSELWVSMAGATTLQAEPAARFKGWNGGVSQSDIMVNPLEYTLSRGMQLTPKFKLGFVIKFH